MSREPDQFEKVAGVAVIATVLLTLVLWGVGIWGFIEFIKWITSK